MHLALQALPAELSVVGFVAVSNPDQYIGVMEGILVQMQRCQASGTSNWAVCRERGFGCNSTNCSLALIPVSMLTVSWMSGCGSWLGCSLRGAGTWNSSQ